MNLIIFFIVTAACIFYLSLPYFRKNSGSLIDLDNLSELRKERVLLELNNELENGTITIEQFNELREKLLKILASVEAKIDFPEDDLPEDILNNINHEVKSIRQEIEKVLNDQKVGERIREGFKIAIAVSYTHLTLPTKRIV